MIGNLTVAAAIGGGGGGDYGTAHAEGTAAVKALAMFVLGFGSFALGVVPMKLSKWWRVGPSPSGNGHGHLHDGHGHGHSHGGQASGSRVVSLLLCFGGGVLLYTTFLHLQPEVRNDVSRLQKAGRSLPGGEIAAELLFIAGFFMVYVLEETVHLVIDWYSAKELRQGEEALQRSVMSLRRRSLSVPQDVTDGGGNNGGTAADDEQRPTDDGGSNTSDKVHSLRGLITVFALSSHELFEGLAIGLEPRPADLMYLCFAVATHKLTIAFCFGLDLFWSNTRKSVLVLYVSTFAAVTPVGIACGMMLLSFGDGGSSVDVAAVLLKGLAAGTLLYVVFFEVLARYKPAGIINLLSIMFGFGIMVLVQLTTHHHHGHDDTNNHYGHHHHAHGYSHHNEVGHHDHDH